MALPDQGWISGSVESQVKATHGLPQLSATIVRASGLCSLFDWLRHKKLTKHALTDTCLMDLVRFVNVVRVTMSLILPWSEMLAQSIEQNLLYYFALSPIIRLFSDWQQKLLISIKFCPMVEKQNGSCYMVRQNLVRNFIFKCMAQTFRDPSIRLPSLQIYIFTRAVNETCTKVWTPSWKSTMHNFKKLSHLWFICWFCGGFFIFLFLKNSK